MPTVGWILENTVDRFWESRARPVVHSARAFVCGNCRRTFAGQRQLVQHLAMAHPLPVPTLFVRGHPLLRRNVLRSRFKSHDVDVLECTSSAVRIDGAPWRDLETAALAEKLADLRDAVVEIRLFNDRSQDGTRSMSEYHVRLRHAEADTLDQIDEYFLRTLVVEEVSHAAIARFEALLPPSSPEREYGAALGDYVLGILLKERRTPPKAPIDFAEFASKMKGALEILHEFDRPVALAVAGAIRFNVNDFHDYGVRGPAEVVRALSLFRALAGYDTIEDIRQVTVRVPEQAPICPVDHLTHLLLSTACALADGSALDQGAARALLESLERAVILSDHDIVKAHVIRAEALMRQGRAAEAAPLLRRLRFHPTMKDFARARLTSDA